MSDPCGHGRFAVERNPAHGDLFVEDSSKRCMIVLSNSSTPGGLVLDGAGEMCTPSLSDPAISGYYVDTNEGFAFARTWMWQHTTFVPREEAEDAARAEHDPLTGRPWVLCVDCKHPTHDCICWYLAEIEAGEREAPDA